jgi:hypothetical protein
MTTPTHGFERINWCLTAVCIIARTGATPSRTLFWLSPRAESAAT